MQTQQMNQINIDIFREHIKQYIEPGSGEIKPPRLFNLGNAVTAWSRGTDAENKTAFEVEDAGGRCRGLTFSELHNAANRFGHLLEQAGLEKGARVLIKLPNCPEYPVVFLGAIRAGYIAAPLSNMLTSSEAAFIADDCNAGALVCNKAEWQKLKHDLKHGFRVVVITDADSSEENIRAYSEIGNTESSDFDTVSEVNDPAYLVYTSGTTGKPKGVLHAHRSLLGRLPAASAWFDFSRPQVIMHTGKLNWTYVLGSAMMDPLFHGHTVVAYDGPNDPKKWLELIARHQCTTFIAVPTIYRQILQKTEGSIDDVPTLTHCMSAGEKLSEQVLHDFKDRFGLYIHEGLGMSEISYYLSQPPGVPLKPGATGMVQPGHRVELFNKEMQPVDAGEEGMIVIAADDPGLFLRYYNRPDADKKAVKDGWFMTGDYAVRDEDGYVFFMGRKDDIINSFGFRVSPFEIERILKDHGAVAECAVVGEEIAPQKTLISAAVVRHKGADVSEEEIISFLAEKLAQYKVPKKVTFFESLPRTRNGKILRKELKKQLIQA